MSTLIVEICKIEEVLSHPNADRLDIITIKGWNCVTGKDSFTVGDLALYIPIDSILPEELENKIFKDSKVKLDKHRVRTIKLRGIISQGLVVQPEVVGIYNYKLGQDFASYLGITKYEPPQELPNAYGKCNKSKKRYINSNFCKYTDIANFKNHPKVFEDGEQVYISEKLHGTSFRCGWVENEANTYWKKIKKFFGLLSKYEFVWGCFDYFTQISLADGSSEYIGKIVANKLPIKVLGMDNNGKVIETKILFYFNNGESQEWIRIKYERKGVGSGAPIGAFMCTPNHLIFDPKNNLYIEANKLNIGDNILMKRPRIKISPAQEQILIGIMLGDASLNENSISFGHKKEHEEYLDYIIQSLGNIAGNKQKEMVSGHGTLMTRGKTIARQDIYNLFSDWFINGKKQIPQSIIGNLSPISLAFWYMDDGTLMRNENTYSISFATQGFSLQSCEILINSLRMLGIDAKIQIENDKKEDKKYLIRLDSYNSEKLFLFISPYMPKCMQYKLPEKYRNFIPILLKSAENIFYNDLKEVQILDIQKINKRKIKYDIETETHNYFAGGILVHNSRTVQLSSPKYEKKYFYDENVYAKTVKQYDLKNRLQHGEVLYGEIIGDHIQKNYFYGCREGETKLYAYDIMKDGKWLDPIDFVVFCGNSKIPKVPLLYFGSYSKEIVEEYTKGCSVIDTNGTPIREGCVVKPIIKSNSPYVGRKVLKSINDMYLLLKDNSDFH